MPSNNFDPNPQDHEERIKKLKQRAKELAGGQMIEGKIDDAPPQVEEGFWNYVVEWEEAPETTHLKQLEDAGVGLPAPETLSDAELTTKLWEVIEKLATFRAFLHETNHLSDRELYTLLLTEILPEETKDLSRVHETNCQIPLLGSGSEEDHYLYLKYYADEKDREFWRKESPEAPMPEHVDPPYDRDRFLPEADYGPPYESENNLN
jgi:hypothetical protein